MSSQASQAAKKILGDVSSEIYESKSYDLVPVDLIETETELIALVALAGASKENIDLRATEDSLTVDARMVPREGKYLRQEMGTSAPPPGDQASHGDQAGAGQGQLQGRHTGGAPAQAGGGECAEGDGGVEGNPQIYNFFSSYSH